MCYDIYVEVIRQLVEVSAFLLPRSTRVSKSSHQPWQQVASSTESTQ